MGITPFYDLYPKDPVENLGWRIRCRKRALEDLEFQRALYDACLSGDTLVVTDHGLLPITETSSQHRVWDGRMWVHHDGCVYRGERETISAYGIELTPDHQVSTIRGWSDASNRFDRTEVRLPDGYREKWFREEPCGVAVPLRLRKSSNVAECEPSLRRHEELRLLPQTVGSSEEPYSWTFWRTDLSHMGEHERQVYESNIGKLSQLWWERNFSVQEVGKLRGIFGGHGREATQFDVGANRQRWQLRTGKLPLGNRLATGQQPTQQQVARNIFGRIDTSRGSPQGWSESIGDSTPHQEGPPGGRLTSSTPPRQAVYDLLNCGSRQAFTVIDSSGRPLLVHNCMIDPLFFMAFCCWSCEPRVQVKVRPFIPWIHQEPVFVAMDGAIDDAEREERSIDVVLDKSRAQGGTFGYLWLHLRRWLRDPMFSAGYVTRNEMLVDSATDDSTLFWKLAWGIERLPFWMLPPGFDMKKHRSLSAHSLLNPANGATLVGYAAGQDVGAGGRKTVFTCDEFGAKDFISGGKDESVMMALHDVTNCLAGYVPVLTDYGLIPIGKVEWFHRVWDGKMWVSHDGCVYRGEQETISVYGIRLTPDHQVLTTKGWKNASIEGLEREEIRLPDGYREKWIDEVPQAEMAVPVSVRQSDNSFRELSADGSHQELWLPARSTTWNVLHSRIRCVDGNETAMPKSESPLLSPVWRTWDRCLRTVAEFCEFLRGHGKTASRMDPGPDRRQQGLRARQLPLGDTAGPGQQQAHESRRGNLTRQVDGGSDREGGGTLFSYNNEPGQEGVDGRQVVSPTTTPRTEAVYDLFNCGPRRAFTVIDEAGRPLLVHNCIFLVSARYADSGVFHEACEDSASSGLHLILDWKDNPIHAKDSYVVRDRKPEARKPEEQGAVNDYHANHPDLRDRLERKGFKFEDIVRSPWYDMRCLRPTSTPRLIASQLDRDPRGAVGKVFPTELLDRVKRQKCKPAVWQGVPVFNSETLRLKGLITRDDGPLKLWFRPGPDNSCPLGPFTIGCDVAIGSDGAYSSNSVASGIDDRTGEQVLEYTVKGMPMIKFARNVVGLSWWLQRAFLGWEDSGMVGPFAKEIMEVLYYGNVYYRDVPEIGTKRKTRKAGWWNGKDEHKADLFEKMALAMETEEYTIRSVDLIRECGEYEWEKGKIIHQPTKNKGATEKAHGDRCIAAGVAWLLYSERRDGISLDSSEESGQTPEYGSFLWCEQQERPRVEADSPEFGLRHVVNC